MKILTNFRNFFNFQDDISSDNMVQVTDSGIPGIISHGVPDWLYEGKSYFKSNHFIRPIRNTALAIYAHLIACCVFLLINLDAMYAMK